MENIWNFSNAQTSYNVIRAILWEDSLKALNQ